jgi:molybdenum cofactor cytidylyltransferase
MASVSSVVNSKMNISAIIISAGSSGRMGQPKALLAIKGKTFLRNIVDTMYKSGFEDVIIVLGSESEKIQNTISWFKGKIVINQDWKQGQLSSIITGLNNVDQTQYSAALIWPVDHPCVSPKLLLELVKKFDKGSHKIIVPKYGERRGHPVIIAGSLFEEIKFAPKDIGMKSVIHSHPEEVCEVKTTDQGVITNVDTPEEYQKWVEKGAWS